MQGTLMATRRRSRAHQNTCQPVTRVLEHPLSPNEIGDALLC
jgi:hypothetical protein